MKSNFRTPEERLDALIKNLELNTQGDPKKSVSYEKSMEYFEKFSKINFKDCLVMYTSIDDVWDVWLWVDEKKQFTFIWNEDREFIMSVYFGQELILCQEYDNIDLVLEKCDRIMEELDKKYKEHQNINQKQFTSSKTTEKGLFKNCMEEWMEVWKKFFGQQR